MLRFLGDSELFPFPWNLRGSPSGSVRDTIFIGLTVAISNPDRLVISLPKCADFLAGKLLEAAGFPKLKWDTKGGSAPSRPLVRERLAEKK